MYDKLDLDSRSIDQPRSDPDNKNRRSSRSLQRRPSFRSAIPPQEADRLIWIRSTSTLPPSSATEHTYNSADSIASGDAYQNLYPIEFLNNQNPTGLPPHQLKLKVNTPVMLWRNLNPSQGLLNGTRLLIKTLVRRVIQAKKMTGTHAGHIVFIPRIALKTTKDCHLPFTLTRRQFQIKPS